MLSEDLLRLSDPRDAAGGDASPSTGGAALRTTDRTGRDSVLQNKRLPFVFTGDSWRKLAQPPSYGAADGCFFIFSAVTRLKKVKKRNFSLSLGCAAVPRSSARTPRPVHSYQVPHSYIRVHDLYVVCTVGLIGGYFEPDSFNCLFTAVPFVRHFL